jgi:AAA15 family ATPase/GTPase
MENKTKVIKRSYNLKNLYLDPNNYRFVDNNDYEKIDDDKILNPTIQKRTKSFIEGYRRENIKDLLSSFKSNGFLDIDVIQVRDLGDNNYQVLEGNRRVATLKALQEDFENGISIGNLNSDIFKSIPFEIHENETNEKHLIVMGLKHISGNKKWAAINQAQLIFDFLSLYWETQEYYTKETELCNSLGISKTELRLSQRAYHLILKYKQSEYAEQFKSSDYSLFVMITRRQNIKSWLEWDDNNYTSTNIENLNRLFSWISKDIRFVEETEEYEELEAIITKSTEISDLSLFIHNNNALNEMEEYRSISRGLLYSGEIDQKNYEKNYDDLKKSVKKLSKYKDMISPDDLESLLDIKKDFELLLPKENHIDISTGNIHKIFEFDKNTKHFDSIHINSYKIFNDFKIDNLNKINIFAGFNNSGKTSLIEAIYLLTKQNDISSFFELLKFKNKLKVLSPSWLNNIFEKEISVSGIYNEIDTSINIKKYEATDIDKKNDYLSSYKILSVTDDRSLNSIVHTYKFENISREYEKIEHLCSSLLKSPFYFNRDEVSQTYDKSLVYKNDEKVTAIDMIVEFLKNIDKNIKDIRFSDAYDIERFIVDSEITSDNLDLTGYGEGLQRVFEIALSFAYARNGIVCIDEFETAIHHLLLIDFTKFVQELSNIFNVQVFITSHSKECIDAFVCNDYENDKIMAYFLENQDSNITYQSVTGDKLKHYIEKLDFDLRGSDRG